MTSSSSIVRLVFILLFAMAGSVASAADHVGEVKALKHIVALKFNETATSEQIDEVVRLIRQFPQEIPVVQSVEGGKNVSFEGQDKGFTHCFTITFLNQAGLKTYLPHEFHMAMVEKVKPLLADVFVIDYYVY